MNIFVLVKHVMDVELNIRVRDGAIVEDGMQYVLSRWDENALEAGLQLKEALGGEVTAVTVGPERAGESLRKALAMGADKALHVSDPAAEGSDAMGYARILAALMERQSYDLILCGRQAQDTDMGATGPMLAEFLSIPQVFNVVHIEPGDQSALTAHRNGDLGREVTRVRLPALLTANDSLNEPRLASLRGIMQAKKKPMETLSLADLGVDAATVGPSGAGIAVAEVMLPPPRQAGKKLEGEPEEIAHEAAELLINEAKLLG